MGNKASNAAHESTSAGLSSTVAETGIAGHPDACQAPSAPSSSSSAAKKPAQPKREGKQDDDWDDPPSEISNDKPAERLFPSDLTDLPADLVISCKRTHVSYAVTTYSLVKGAARMDEDNKYQTHVLTPAERSKLLSILKSFSVISFTSVPTFNKNCYHSITMRSSVMKRQISSIVYEDSVSWFNSFIGGLCVNAPWEYFKAEVTEEDKKYWEEEYGQRASGPTFDNKSRQARRELMSDLVNTVLAANQDKLKSTLMSSVGNSASSISTGANDSGTESVVTIMSAHILRIILDYEDEDKQTRVNFLGSIAAGMKLKKVDS